MGLIVQDILTLILGFILLIKGAQFLINGATALANKYAIPDFIIGMTVLAFGTSLPELTVNVLSSYRGFHNMVFATAIGANIFNLYVILGLVGLIIPFNLQNRIIWVEIPLMMLITVLVFIITNDALIFGKASNSIDFYDSIILLVAFFIYLLIIYGSLKRSNYETAVLITKAVPVWKVLLWIIGGSIATSFGGDLVVDEAAKISSYFEVTRRFFGITVIATFTSLPELVTSSIAIYRKKPDLAFGNILGSSIFNFLFVLGVAGLIQEIPYNKGFNFDLNFFFFGTVLLFVGMFSGKMKRLDRWQSFIFLMFFIAYIYFVVVRV
ncbi:MAG: sodium:calcium antiporter [Bacteroidota bacterium]